VFVYNYNYMIPPSFLHAACLLYHAICSCPVCPMYHAICANLRILTHHHQTPHSFFLFQFLILLNLSFNRGNRLHVSIVPLNTPKPINIIQDKVSTTANAIQYVFTEYVIPRSADTYSVKKVSGRNRMVALLMSSATLVRRSTPADCDMATSWKFCFGYVSTRRIQGNKQPLTICTSPSF
jgi:hypothetical protein